LITSGFLRLAKLAARKEMVTISSECEDLQSVQPILTTAATCTISESLTRKAAFERNGELKTSSLPSPPKQKS
jgi:hypothetical protein